LRTVSFFPVAGLQVGRPSGSAGRRRPGDVARSPGHAGHATLAKQPQAVDIAGVAESFQHTVALLDALLGSPELR
jgi:hypothetical protein